MREPVLAASQAWWGARQEPDFTAAEIVGPDAIADLAAARFDHERLRRRVDAGIQPVTDALALRVLLAARRRTHTTSELAAICRVSPSGVRRAISIAVDHGALVRQGRSHFRTHSAWAPATARLVAIELKLDDWSSALQQAYAYSLWANVAWVVLASATRADILAAAGADGVGGALLTADGELRRLVRPTPRRRPALPFASIWAGEQVVARALSAGFSLRAASRLPRAQPAMRRGELAASRL